MSTNTKRLRVLGVIVQPVLVWDDGETLTPADPVQATQVPLSALAGLADEIEAKVTQAQLPEQTTSTMPERSPS